jgi:acetyltransferase-like isoleucine patch superfamily enzyme
MDRLLRKLVRRQPGDGLREFALGGWLLRASKSQRLAAWSLRKALTLEGGDIYSVTARKIMFARHGVTIGAYSYGACFDVGAFAHGVVVGRYVSIGPRARAYAANHPLDRLSTHAFFFNQELGYVPETNIPFTRLVIEADAWVGDSVIVTPRCQRIGLGAVVGAGSIVTRDVPDFAVVAGNPARLIKYRFSPEVQELIRQSRWWERPVSECARYTTFMSAPLDADAVNHPLLRGMKAQPARYEAAVAAAH